MDDASSPDGASSGHDQPDAVVTTSQGVATLASPTTVFRLSDLPFELQLEIWEYLVAAEADSRVLHQNFFFDVRTPVYHFPNRFPTAYAGFVRAAARVYNGRGTELQFSIRRSMMGICRVSRKYALEAWKKDLEAIVTTLDATNSKPTDRFWVTNTRAELLGLLDARIQGLVRRMNGQI